MTNDTPPYDEQQPLRRYAPRKQGLGDGARAGAELDNGPIAAQVDLAGHRLGEGRPGRRDCADDARILDPLSEKSRAVGEKGLWWFGTQHGRRTLPLRAWPKFETLKRPTR